MVQMRPGIPTRNFLAKNGDKLPENSGKMAFV